MRKGFVRLTLIVLFLAMVYLIRFDLGRFQQVPGGAGEIWWTTVPQINEAYQNTQRSSLSIQP